MNSDGRLTSGGKSKEWMPPDGYDEEVALKMAIEESRKSATRTTTMMTTDLLDLDDETFANSLDGMKKPVSPSQASNLPQIPSWSIPVGGSKSTGAITATTTSNNDPFAGGQDYKEGMSRSRHLAISVPQIDIPQGACDKDPFADVTETFKKSLTLSQTASSLMKKSGMEERVPMPLPLGQALPGAEVQTGAKPVTPGSYAPQFGYKDPPKSKEGGGWYGHAE